METTEKTWDEMDGWEKTGTVVVAVGSLALIVLALLSGGKAPPQPRKPAAWRPKFYGPKGVRKGWKY